MKKLIAVMLALVLALGLGCAALAETADAPEITADNWLLKSLTDTDWILQEGSATLEVLPNLDDTTNERFLVNLTWPSSETDGLKWIFEGTYVWENQTMYLTREYCYEETYNEDGEPELSNSVYDRDCDVMLMPDESGILILRGSEDEQISLIGFEPVPATQEKVQALTEDQANIFAMATEGLLGMDYEPVGLLDEADGIMYCFLCKGTVVAPGTEPVYYLALVNNGILEGPTAQFIQIMDDGSEG